MRAFVASRGEEPFRLLFRRHTPALLRLAQRLLGREAAEQAEDAVQEAWIRAACRLGDFRFESKLRTWLCGFVVNRCRELLRARGAMSAAASTPSPEPIAAAGDALVALDLERAVAGLPDGYRTVLVLHDLMGYTHREVAARLGIEEGTSKSQLFLARRALRLPGGEPATTASGPQGFFLVRARDEAEAEAIALDCPHLRHGGRVAVHAVDAT